MTTKELLAKRKLVTQGLNGIDPDIKIKFGILSKVLGIPKIKLFNIMIEKFWEENQDLVTDVTNGTTYKINKKVDLILRDLTPKQ